MKKKPTNNNEYNAHMRLLHKEKVELSTADKLRSYYLGKDVILHEKTEALRVTYEMIIGLFQKGHSRSDIAKYVSKARNITQNRVYAQINQALEVWGEVIDFPQKAYKLMLIEQFQLVAKVAQANEDLIAWSKALENIAKIVQAFEPEKDKIDFSKMKHVTINFSTDSRHLENLQVDNVIEVNEVIEDE